jgi:hypothetical protein
MTPRPLPRSTVALYDWAAAGMVGSFLFALVMALRWGIGS